MAGSNVIGKSFRIFQPAMDSLFQTEAKNLYLFLDNVAENKKDFYIFVSFNKIKIYVTENGCFMGRIFISV